MNKALVKFLLVPQVYTVKGLAEACWCFLSEWGSVSHSTGAGGYLIGSDCPKIITDATLF